MGSILAEGSRPETADFLIAVFFALVLFCARFILDTFIYQPLSVQFVCGRFIPAKIDEAKRAKIIKCCESLWKLTYYITVQLWVFSIMKEGPSPLNTRAYLEGWPNQELKVSVKLFYMCQCGFYLYSIGALLIWETRRKDFGIMMSHHIITSLLIGYSFLTSFFRIGSVILALHDASDVFMETAKVFKYSEKELAASVCFGLFAISWLLLRLIFFPFWIIKTSSYHSFQYLKSPEGFPRTLYYGVNTMLLSLLIFHIYWWVLICSMIKRQMSNKGQVGEDIRSDSEGDD
ncbi:ceramide synthetase protein [Dioscorea alata]|uniref:Ceramide synthetase protein n=2 Tax=Dioscorea alata TaxID=55571 RepID=A0ACB7VGK4_DIOAL|nr:ceramide synthetase protein [Dioscorea alata]